MPETISIRMHRGGFAESVETMRTIDATAYSIQNYLLDYGVIVDAAQIELYDDYPDPRINWDSTYLVRCDGRIVAFVDSNKIMPDTTDTPEPKTYTLDEIKEAFSRAFYKSGEVFFSYTDDDQAKRDVDVWFDDLLENLDKGVADAEHERKYSGL